YHHRLRVERGYGVVKRGYVCCIGCPVTKHPEGISKPDQSFNVKRPQVSGHLTILSLDSSRDKKGTLRVGRVLNWQ
ncbi:hypothetical protein Q4595_28130, partial [Wenyingzhuangia sp. 1_MG-2023]|nr:hypothetical protein [Wenyingzhuangia sp. 1_MG-2023]